MGGMKRWKKKLAFGVELVEEGVWVLVLGEFRVWIEAKRPGSIWYEEVGKCPKGKGGLVLDWIEETINRVRGL